MAEKDPKWMEHAAERMKEKGTVGSFGPATKKNIASGRKLGGKEKKKAIFAETAAKVARKHEGRKKE